MSEIRQRDSVRLSEAGKQDFKKAKANKRNHDGKVWRYLDIANEAGVSEKTVKRFFSGKEDVDYESAVAIATALEVNDLEKWLEPKESNSPDNTPETLIDWHHVCHEMLKTQQEKQKFRQQITGRGLGHEVNVYVPLGLVKPKEQPRRGEDFQPSAERGMQQYRLTEKEIEREYKHNEFLQQVIEGKDKNLAIVGEPGAGKSTWLEEIALYVDNPEKGFPICISLASLGGKTLEDYLLQNWLEDALPFISPDVFEVTPALEKKLKELFSNGKVWLLLDGVDELRLGANESPLQTIANQLRGWIDRARVVLTCRLNVWETNPNVLPNFETYRTLHFDDEQVGEFIQQWFTHEGKPELGEQLEDKLGELGQERIQDLIKNPLRLAMLCKIWYLKPGDLPKTKAILYQRFRDDFYQWKPHPLLTDDLDKQEELHAALSKLALEAIKKKLSLREKFAYEVMGKSLFQLACEVGWLNLVYEDAETDEDIYAFFHLTFQEYFAACAIDDWHFFLNQVPHNPEFGVYRIFEPQWKEVIVLWLGREDVSKQEKQEFIKALVEFEDGCWYFYRNRAYLLAAAGIAEFRDCSLRELRDEIVGLLVDWSFCTHYIFKKNILVEEKPIDAYGYFPVRETFENILKWIENKWQKSIPSIEAAREVLKETDREIAAALLVELLENNKDVYSEDVAFLLGQIDPGNQTAIATLVDFTQPDIELNMFEEQRVSAASNLAKIAPGNEAAITALVDVIQTAFYEDSYEENTLEAAKSLARIDPGNKTATTFLVKWIETECIDEYDLWVAADSLGRIDPGNETAIATLVQLVNVAKDKYLRHLGALLNLSEETSLISLSELKILIKHCHLLAESLGEINSDNETAITTLEELLNPLNPNLDKDILNARCYVAESLGKIDPGNKTVIAILVELIQKTEDEETRSEAVRILGEIGTGNEKAIAALIELIQNGGDEDELVATAESLGKIDPGNKIAIATLVKLILNGRDEDEIAANSLNSILQGDQFPKVVTALKHYMTDLVYENNFSFYSACHDVLWRCAQNMTYPDFYQAWHHPPLAFHPEIAETSGVGFTPDSQRLNLAGFPSLLHAAINSDSKLRDKVQIICIDGSKFIDPDNPTTKIYNEMRRQGCPKSEDTKPKTMAQLQDYWDELNLESDKHLVLVFYESTLLTKRRNSREGRI
jgi:HEAT repeat protein/transcriptional regulator with XRE-family HTH domain